jgi:hypothetical protein
MVCTGVHDQPAAGELTLGLNEQVKPVNDEVKLRNDPFSLEVIGQEVGVVIRQCRFATALGVPDALPHANAKGHDLLLG